VNVLDFDRTGRIDLDWGPISVHLAGRTVFFLWVTLALLALAGIAVFVSRKRELITRWTTWALIAPVVGLPIWCGRGATAALAAALGVLAVLEYARLARLAPRSAHHADRRDTADRDTDGRGIDGRGIDGFGIDGFGIDGFGATTSTGQRGGRRPARAERVVVVELWDIDIEGVAWAPSRLRLSCLVGLSRLAVQAELPRWAASGTASTTP
jgi:hypothetical protein